MSYANCVTLHPSHTTRNCTHCLRKEGSRGLIRFVPRKRWGIPIFGPPWGTHTWRKNTCVSLWRRIRIALQVEGCEYLTRWGLEILCPPRIRGPNIGSRADVH